MNDRITPKAHNTLLFINAGRRELISNQMIDRLSARGFIDFAVDRDGWFLTAEGEEALWSL
jgi:hypothetical protein